MSPSALKTIRLLPWFALCVIAPSAVLGLAGNALTAPPAWEATAQVRLMDTQLAAQPVDVLTLGPSVARTDIDAATLGAGLATPPLSVARLSQPQASAPMWYAILRERVYAAGFSPKLVVLVATMDTLLTVRPPDTHLPLLTQHFIEPDAVLLRKALNSPWPTYVQRALASRASLRGRLLTWFRDAPAGALFGAGTAEGAALVAAASEKALGEHHVPEAGRFAAFGGTERAGGADAKATRLSPPEQSFLPDLAALVAAHGGRLAVVLPPTSTQRPSGFRVDPVLERETLQLANQLGVTWVDLRDWTDRDGDFADGLHLTAEAAPRFTAEMAARLTAANALGPGAPIAATVPPPVPTRSRTGLPPIVATGTAEAGPGACTSSLPVPEFAAFGEDRLLRVSPGLPSPLRVLADGLPLVRGAVREGPCMGRFSHRSGTLSVSSSRPGAALSVEVDPASSWVWPGSALVWTYDAAWHEQGAAVVHAEIVLIGPPETTPPTLRVGGASIPFTGSGPKRTLDLPLGAALGGELAVEAPVGGAWVAVRSLAVSVGAFTSVLVKPPVRPRLDLISAVQFTPNPAPRLTLGPWLGTRTNRRVAAPWTDHSTCSPVRVFEDGALLPGIPRVGAWISVSPADGSDPATNGRSYTLALADDRRCEGKAQKHTKGRTWMYPGDRFVGEVSVTKVAADIGSLRALVVPTQPLPSGTLHLALRVGTEVRFDQSLPVSDLVRETVLPLNLPLHASGREPIEVEATLSTDAAPILLSWFGVEE